MRARTIGQIATLIAGHMGGKTATAAPEACCCCGPSGNFSNR